MADRQPDTPAIIFPRRGGAPETVTYRELDRDCDDIAHGLIALGIGRGVRTAVFVTPSPDFFALIFALFKVGAVPVFLDTGMGVKAVGRCLAEVAPQGFIGVAKAHVARLLFAWGKGSVEHKVAVGSWLRWGGSTLDDLRRAGEGQGPFLPIDPDDDELGAILFTSGSTGPAKGVEYTHANFVAQVEMLRDLFGIEPGEVDLPTFPLFALFDPALGMTTVVPQMDFANPGRVDPQNLLDPIREFGVTNWFGSPAVLRRVAEHASDTDGLPSLRRVLSAGAPVPPDVLERVADRLSAGVQVHTPYGATECLPVASTGSAEILDETAAATWEGRGVCVGRAVPPNEVRVIAIDDGPLPEWGDVTELPNGEIGEFVVTGPTVTRAYFHRDGATAAAKVRDAAGRLWHRMGDVGYLDDQDRLWFCGRKSHRVRSRTGDLFTLQCEPVFHDTPGVGRCALVGVPLLGGYDVPILVVESTATGAAWRATQDRLRKAAVRFAHTEPIETFLAYPGPLPVDPRHNAKIRREVLREWAAGRDT